MASNNMFRKSKTCEILGPTQCAISPLSGYSSQGHMQSIGGVDTNETDACWRDWIKYDGFDLQN